MLVRTVTIYRGEVKEPVPIQLDENSIRFADRLTSTCKVAILKATVMRLLLNQNLSVYSLTTNT